VGVLETKLDELAAQTAAYNQSHGTGIKVVFGEQAHAIQFDTSTGMQIPINGEYAVQWRGAVSTADFLMMISAKPAVERAHYFIFGNGVATWHPIRLNESSNPNPYTIMPVTDLYERLGSIVQGKSLAVTTTSPLPGDLE